jgi:hypothetical protein
MIHASLEEHLQTHCPNCGKEHDAKFLSHFTEDKHYIVGDCANCGYRIEIARNDLGSGLFLPDGSVATISEVFKSKHVEHVKERLKEQNVATFLPSFSTMQLRLLPAPREQRKEPKKEEKQ